MDKDEKYQGPDTITAALGTGAVDAAISATTLAVAGAGIMAAVAHTKIGAEAIAQVAVKRGYSTEFATKGAIAGWGAIGAATGAVLGGVYGAITGMNSAEAAQRQFSDIVREKSHVKELEQQRLAATQHHAGDSKS